ncbi:MAG: NADH-quinone oxidoreductase subunit G, partial [Gammaproteobacteria bacterium]|nr:NADH-quinone oxidoreductase subunit G [Gammaproteobacteria bacterium]
DCPICDQGGECELQDVAMGYGRDVSRYVEGKRVVKDKDLGPLIATDMTRCIHCTRCVRFGAEIGGLPELGQTGRGENSRIGTFVEKNVESELSGNVIDLCPVGALTNKPFRFRARTWELQQRPSLAPHDGLGSNLSVHTARNQVLRVVPRANESINEVWLSDRDRFSYAGLYSDDRLSRPMVKRSGTWQETDWEDAINAAVDGLRRALADGPQGLGALSSPSATLEELYLTQKLVRTAGSNNVDHRLGQSDFSDQEGWPSVPGLGVSIADVEKQDVILIVGTNLRKALPMLNHRVRKAALAGARVFVLNATADELNHPVAGALITRPDSWAAELAGMVVAAGGSLSIRKKVKPSDGQTTIAEALKSAERASVLLGAGVLNHPDGAALRSLAASLCKASQSSLGLLCDGANGSGAWYAGAVPHRLPGGTAVDAPGAHAGQMLSTGLKGLLLLGCEPEMEASDSATALAALARTDCVVAMSAYKSERMLEYADVLLPISPYAETPGSYVNLEGCLQRVEAAVAPSGDSRPAWKILRVLGNLLGLEGFGFTQLQQVRDEMATAAGVLDAAAFGAAQADASWSTLDKLPAAEKTPYRLGDVPIYATDAIVRRSAPLQATVDARFRGVTVNPALAKSLGAAMGDTVRVRQGQCEATFELVVSESVADGCVQLPAGLSETVGLGSAYGAIELSSA